MAAIDIPPLNELPELVIGQIDAVVRQTAAGRDASGAVVVAETTVYTDWPATLDLEPAGGDLVFGQPVMQYVGTFYVAPAADGTLPDIRKRDLLDRRDVAVGGRADIYCR